VTIGKGNVRLIRTSLQSEIVDRSTSEVEGPEARSVDDKVRKERKPAV